MLFPDGGAPGQVVLSASDLRAASECEHALLAELDVATGRSPASPLEVDEVAARAADLGTAHEQRVLRALATAHPSGVRSPDGPAPTPQGYREAMHQTLALMADPQVAVIHQACVYDGGLPGTATPLVGFADFLVRGDDGAWIVCDAKLARSESVTALLQIGAYADILQRALAALDGEAKGEVRLAPFARLILGDDEVSDTALADLLPVVRARRARLTSLVTDHLAEHDPVGWGDPRLDACLSCPHCQRHLEARDDVLLVAGVHADQRARLAAVGVETITGLADLPEDARVPGLRPDRLQRLRAQARLQLRARETASDGASGEASLPVEVHTPGALAILPPPSEGDVFFDFEGDPMWHEPGSRVWGLEYLFGCLTHDGGARTYRAFWAHSRADEGRALMDFLGWLQERRRRWPDLHVYHYADYERAALLRLAARHGVGQQVVDALLVDGVLVDLYPVVKAGVRVGTGSYSIKKLEPLYMGDELRDADGVTGGGDSIVEYHRYVQAGLDGDGALAAERLEDIRQYNEYDCLSTLRLRDWLLARADEHGIAPTPGRAAPDPDEQVEDEHPVEVAVRERLGDLPREQRTAEQQALAMLGAAVQYHRREAKPHWWGHFDRLESPAEQWVRSGDVFVTETARVLQRWERPTPRSNPVRLLELRGELNPGLASRVGGSLVAVYGDPVPPCLAKDKLPHGAREVTIQDLSSTVDEHGVEVSTIVVAEKLPKGGEEYHCLPIGLGPSAPPPAGKIVEALERVASEALDAEGATAAPATPALDLLRRVPPRLTGRPHLPRTGDSVADVRDALLALDHSYLAVQGPPGTGKTYVGSRVVAELVLTHRWRVAVTSQSHAAVENFLDAVVEAGVPAGQVGKRDAKGDQPAWTVLEGYGHAGFAAEHDEAGRGYVIGGTAWDLTHPERIEPGQCDLVVVDEAGQFAVAPTVAVSTAGRRLLLLGDPQQLPQVSQGTHSEPVDASALGWLLDGASTMPEDLGYFLPDTWRMHPDLTAPISRLAYDDQLGSKADVTGARSLEGVAPGLHVVPVDHADRRTSSPEEAEAIRDLITSLQGRTWTDPGADEGGGARPLRPADVLVVTAYNHQVRTVRAALDAAGLAETVVGTVDKLQGQQAPVVIVSMCASTVHDVSRGLRFLLSRNRLNVAISRGQHAAYVVMSPRLVEAAPRSPGELRALGAFMGLVTDSRTP